MYKSLCDEPIYTLLEFPLSHLHHLQKTVLDFCISLEGALKITRHGTSIPRCGRSAE